jgi:hypothetical protein
MGRTTHRLTVLIAAWPALSWALARSSPGRTQMFRFELQSRLQFGRIGLVDAVHSPSSDGHPCGRPTDRVAALQWALLKNAHLMTRYGAATIAPRPKCEPPLSPDERPQGPQGSAENRKRVSAQQGSSRRFLNHLLFENRKFCYSVWIGGRECAPFEGQAAAPQDGKEFFV